MAVSWILTIAMGGNQPLIHFWSNNRQCQLWMYLCCRAQTLAKGKQWTETCTDAMHCARMGSCPVSRQMRINKYQWRPVQYQAPDKPTAARQGRTSCYDSILWSTDSKLIHIKQYTEESRKSHAVHYIYNSRCENAFQQANKLTELELGQSLYYGSWSNCSQLILQCKPPKCAIKDKKAGKQNYRYRFFVLWWIITGINQQCCHKYQLSSATPMLLVLKWQDLVSHVLAS